nr:extracellular solute-binding protein [Bifidobacterium breve]
MRFSKTATAVIAMIAMIAPTAACGTENASSDGKTEITVWAWDNNLKANAKQFMKDNPDIKVTFANAGSSKDEYVALSNAIEAGSGAPDIAQIEYYAIPEYAIPDVYLEVQHPCWSCNSNSSSANASAGVR